MNEALLIPDDLAACHSLIGQLAQTISEQGQKITTLQQQVQEQQLTINDLMQRAFRHRSERYLEDPNQLKLDFGDTPEAADAAAGLAEAVEEAEIVVAAYKRRKRVSRKPRNEQLPAHLPRYRVEVPASDEIKHCAQHGERKPIGFDEVETLEFEWPKLVAPATILAADGLQHALALLVAPLLLGGELRELLSSAGSRSACVSAWRDAGQVSTHRAWHRARIAVSTSMMIRPWELCTTGKPR